MSCTKKGNNLFSCLWKTSFQWQELPSNDLTQCNALYIFTSFPAWAYFGPVLGAVNYIMLRDASFSNCPKFLKIFIILFFIHACPAFAKQALTRFELKSTSFLTPGWFRKSFNIKIKTSNDESPVPTIDLFTPFRAYRAYFRIQKKR